MSRCTIPTDSVPRWSKARRRSRRLPHYEITEKDSKAIQLLARQPIDPDRPHPFTAAGNTEFNCLLWMPPNQQRSGDIVLVDSTNFTTLFGGTESLQNLWKNFALMK